MRTVKFVRLAFLFLSLLKFFPLAASLSSVGLLMLFYPRTVEAQQAEIEQLEEFLTPAAPPPAPPASAPARATPPLRSVIPPPTPQQTPVTPSPPSNTNSTNTNATNTNASNTNATNATPPQQSTPRSNRSVATERIESTNVGVRTTTAPRLELGPDLGDGNYLVLMAYQGEDSLSLAREYAQGAFIKQYDGKTYIQLASFNQLEYARHMADNLRRQGLSVLILQ